MLVCATHDLSAHRRDELLQAARIAIADNRIEIELSLTPGMAIAEHVIVDLDVNRDGVLSEGEQRDFVAAIRASITVDVDGRRLTLGAGSASFPPLDALGGGDRPIELRFTSALPGMASGRHEIVFGNRYRPDISVYLANALASENERIAVIAQKRDPEQRTLTIDYSVGGERLATLPVWLFGSVAAAWLVFRARREPVRGH